jgi:phage/conjugal plasmid C-4 type zinc finger TraR family protein
MDEADYAQANEEVFLAAALRNRRAAAVAITEESAVICDECGDEIPEERRRAVRGCRLCVICQSQAEKD